MLAVSLLHNHLSLLPMVHMQLSRLLLGTSKLTTAADARAPLSYGGHAWGTDCFDRGASCCVISSLAV